MMFYEFTEDGFMCISEEKVFPSTWEEGEQFEAVTKRNGYMNCISFNDTIKIWENKEGAYLIEFLSDAFNAPFIWLADFTVLLEFTQFIGINILQPSYYQRVVTSADAEFILNRDEFDENSIQITPLGIDTDRILIKSTKPIQTAAEWGREQLERETNEQLDQVRRSIAGR